MDPITPSGPGTQLLHLSPAGLNPNCTSLPEAAVSDREGRMSCRNVLITGCSSGIGLALAVHLARDELRRFRVVATMRDLGRRGELETRAGTALGHTLEIRQLDVDCEESVRRCVEAIPQQRVDVLVSNAGRGLVGPLELQSVEAARRLLDTNVLGLLRLVRQVLPDMKRRRSGHVVVMSSVLGLQGLLFNDLYCASKFAVEGFCESLALQALKFGVHISLIEPGPVATEFERKLYEEAATLDLSGLDPETRELFQGFYLPYSREVFAALAQSPAEVAEHTARVITSESPPFRSQTNSLYAPLATLKHADTSGHLPLAAFQRLIFQHDRLFKASLSLLKLLQWRKRRDMDHTKTP
ncbi:retinol dehydrogenase 8-like isoform X2 [Alligator sinensis]|uniref:Retinol dehydrogenase 8-like isoform X2 n=1 Tax=Alligator sinensis TaxID=38654 RepID=A0A3Q0GK49_ALLSI|nr:retinol dehydrogenase 8-like isoform X2 [Alligator sinensis]